MNGVPKLSPGRLTALWVVLRSVDKLGDGVSAEEVESFARRSALRSGGLPIVDGYRLGIVGGFMTDDPTVRLTRLGREALTRGAEEEPNQDVLRLFASVLVLRHPPAWVAYWQGDPVSLDLVLPEPTKSVLREAALLESSSLEDLETWAWWNALRQVPVDDEAAHRKAIGDAAEELSLAYEKERLRREGFKELASRVRWVAQESPAYGFDILSFCGISHTIGTAETPIAVEVKGMALSLQGEFRLHLTEHEWRTSVALGNRYILHLWNGVHPGIDKRAGREEPYIIESGDLVMHIPREPHCGASCGWTSARVTLLI